MTFEEQKKGKFDDLIAHMLKLRKGKVTAKRFEIIEFENKTKEVGIELSIDAANRERIIYDFEVKK